MFDLRPAADVMAALVESVRDDQLTAPTPGPELTVGDLLDHIDGLSLAFTAAATKTPPAGAANRPPPTLLASAPTGAPGSRSVWPPWPELGARSRHGTG